MTCQRPQAIPNATEVDAVGAFGEDSLIISGASAMPVTMFGIKNCDTVAKARKWLEGEGVAYDFHDYKALGVTAEKLRGWAAEVGWEVLLNKAGTTFRKLPEADRQDIDEAKAVALMVAQPSMIKRPVVEGAGPLLVGFKPERYAAAFDQ